MTNAPIGDPVPVGTIFSTYPLRDAKDAQIEDLINRNDVLIVQINALIKELDELPASPLLDSAGAADYLATSERHVRKLWEKREIPAIKVGRLVRFHKDDLDRYIDSHRQGNPRA